MTEQTSTRFHEYFIRKLAYTIFQRIPCNALNRALADWCVAEHFISDAKNKRIFVESIVRVVGDIDLTEEWFAKHCSQIVDDAFRLLDDHYTEWLPKNEYWEYHNRWRINRYGTLYGARKESA